MKGIEKERKWKYHFLYKTINEKNGKYYIGVHSTNDIEDGYLGSGTALKKSIQYHGRGVYKREILEFFESRENAFIREEEIVNEELLKDPKCMNLTMGGFGFKSEYYNGLSEKTKKLMKLGGKLGNERFKKRLEDDKEFRDSFSKKMTEINKSNPQGFCKNPEVGTKAWTGKAHKEKTKSIIGEKNSIRQEGNKNSQFGTLWINKEGIDKKIKGEEIDFYLKNGWTKGRTLKMSNRKLDNNQVKEIKEMLNENISQRKIAKIFNVSKGTIQKIGDGRSYF